MRYLGPVAFLCVTAILLGAPAQASKAVFDAAGDPNAAPFEDQVGWLDETCLVIRNHDLRPGTPVVVVTWDTYEQLIARGILNRRLAGTILGKTDSGERCRPLAEERRARNEAEDVSFYAVSLEGAPRLGPADTALGIGIVGLKLKKDARIVLDGGIAPGGFTACKTFEGVAFALWPDWSYEGEPLWQAYYYTGEDARDRECVSERHSEEAGEPAGSPFDMAVGWIDQCLAIKNHALQPGTPLTIVMFNEEEDLIEQRILGLRAAGTILGTVQSPEQCPALSEWKGGGNEGEDVSFYAVALDDGPFMNPEDGIFGIGIVGLEPEDTNPIDLDGNGAADSFTACTPFEGTYFSIWSGEPYKDEPLWEGYYYLGYEVEESDCPAIEPKAPPEVVTGSPLDDRIGWLDECLAIKNHALQPGTPVTVVAYAASERLLAARILSKRLSGKILGKTDSTEHCPALNVLENRINETGQVSYYTVAIETAPDVEFPDFGIAIVGLEPGDTDPIDLNGDGAADSFSVCNSWKGIGFDVWGGKPRKGEPLWHGYYHLGYRLSAADCPNLGPAPESGVGSPPRDWDPVFRVGWLLHGCFGISNTQLEPETPIGLMILDRQAGGENNNAVLKKRIAGKILGKTDSGENCFALAENIREWNEYKGFAFYTVAPENGEVIEPNVLGIGVIGPEPGEDPFDLDGNDEADGFSVCNGQEENLRFLAWIGEPYAGEAAGSEALSSDALADQLIWAGLLYLGRKLDGVPDCPADL